MMIYDDTDSYIKLNPVPSIDKRMNRMNRTSMKEAHNSKLAMIQVARWA